MVRGDYVYTEAVYDNDKQGHLVKLKFTPLVCQRQKCVWD